MAQVHNPLRSTRFVNMCLANWLLHVFVFAQIPLFAQRQQILADAYTLSIECIVAFALGMVLQGPFCAHLLEKHKRKALYLNSVFAVALSTFAIMLLPVDYRAAIPFFALVEGAAYGISQISMGGTIVNDMLLSAQRTKGDCVYGWTTRLGIPSGLLAGALLIKNFEFVSGFGWSLCALALSYVFVAQTTIPVKAPVKMSTFTLDRFFLPSSWPRMLMLLPVSLLTGCMLFYATGLWELLAIFAGSLAAWAADSTGNCRQGRFTRLCVGYLLTVLSLALYAFVSTTVYGLVAALFFSAAGLSTASANLLAITVEKSEHCQRGTAQNTHLLVWCVGMATGYCLSFLA